MKKRKLISMLRLLALPVALAIGSPCVSVRADSVNYFRGVGFYFGSVPQNTWSNSDEGVSELVTEEGNVLESAWVICSVRKSANATGNLLGTSLTKNKYYKLTYSATSYDKDGNIIGTEGQSQDVEAYFLNSVSGAKWQKLCDGGQNEIIFKPTNVTTGAFGFKGYKREEGHRIVISNVSLEQVTTTSTITVASYDPQVSDNDFMTYIDSNDVKWLIRDGYTMSGISYGISHNSFTWGPATDAEGNPTGEMYIGTNQYAPADDWLIREFDLTTGDDYDVSFGLRNSHEGKSHNVYVYWGTTIDEVTSKTNSPLWLNTSFSDTEEFNYTYEDFVATADKFYFGVLCKSSTGGSTNNDGKGLYLTKFNVKSKAAQREFTTGENKFDLSTVAVSGERLDGGTYDNEVATDGYCPDFAKMEMSGNASKKSDFTWDGTSEVLAPYQIFVDGLKVGLQGTETNGLPSLSSSQLTLRKNSRIYFYAPANYYIKGVKMYGTGITGTESFDVTANANGTCTYDGENNAFVWSTVNGCEESVMLTCSAESVISSFDIILSDGTDFVAEPDADIRYASTVSIGDGKFDKGWKALDGSTWTAVKEVSGEVMAKTDGTKDAEGNGDLLRSPKIKLEKGKEYLLKMDMNNHFYTANYNCQIYLVASSQDIAENITDENKVAAWSIISNGALDSKEAFITLGERESGEYYFVVKPVQNGGSHHTGITLRRFAVNLLNHENGIYKLTHTDGYSSDIINRNTATVFDFSEYPEALTIMPTNKNAYVIGSNVTRKASAYNDLTTESNVLTYVAADKYAATQIDINADNAFHFGYEVTCDNVNFSRNDLAMTTNFVTMVLPFDIEATDDMARIDGFNGDNSKILFETFTPGSTIDAYTPFIYYKGDSTNLNFSGIGDGVTANAGSGVIVVDNGSAWKQAFVLSETVVEDVTTDAILKDYNVYFFQGGKFWLATGRLTLKPFRAMFLLPKSAGDPIASYQFLINGDIPTGLEEMYYNEDAAANEAPAYNEAGVRVNEGYKGITIRNGKKTIRK